MLISDSKSQSWLDLNTCVNLLVSLGFDINWDKVEPPVQNITFLGVEIDVKKRTLALPEDRLANLRCLLYTWLSKKKASKKAIQKLAGKLCWASRVILGGRTFMRRIIDSTMKLRESHHKTWLNVEFRKDVIWWNKAVYAFHGFTKFSCDIKPPTSELVTDACSLADAGAYGCDWFFTDFQSDFKEYAHKHINCKELLVVLIVARRMGHLWGAPY